MADTVPIPIKKSLIQHHSLCEQNIPNYVNEIYRIKIAPFPFFIND